jgi:hypothetical protein
MVYCAYCPNTILNSKYLAKIRENVAAKRKVFLNENNYLSSLHYCATGLFESKNLNAATVRDFFVKTALKRYYLQYRRHNPLEIINFLELSLDIPDVRVSNSAGTITSQHLYIFSDSDEELLNDQIGFFNQNQNQYQYQYQKRPYMSESSYEEELPFMPYSRHDGINYSFF